MENVNIVNQIVLAIKKDITMINTKVARNVVTIARFAKVIRIVLVVHSDII